MLQCNAFPENPDPLPLMLGGPVVPFVCSFIRRDNLGVVYEPL